MNCGYDLEIWKNYQLKQHIKIRLRTHTSLLLTGSSGSGKSYAMKYLIDKLLEDNVVLTFCNFKNSEDFKFLKSYEHYYTFTDCGDGLNNVYRTFKEVQSADTEFGGLYHILVFDEFPAFIMSTTMNDKKLAEEYKRMIAEILMLGRSYGFGVWLVMQRPDSSFLSNGARDNFHTTISLGNLSKEAKNMLYSGEELPDFIYKTGEGICWIDGIGLKTIKFPRISDMPALENRILNRLQARP